MKTILTLQTSSMFFLGDVNLYKGKPTEINTETLSASTIRMVNNAIGSGTIASTEGLLVTEEVEAEVVEQVEEVAVEAPVEAKRGQTEDILIVDESPVVEAEVKAPVKKKTTPAKKKAE